MVPEKLRYTKDHEWIRVEGDLGVVGITDLAQSELGDIVFVELPKVGAKLEQSATFGSVESVKAVSDIYSPVAGEVVEVNQALADAPEKVNEEPYGEGWIMKLRIGDPAQVEKLMSATEYDEYVGAES
jgi:glycine cleavage system H protein